jgi:hypothetical protein
LRLAAWLLRTFGRYIPQVKGQDSAGIEALLLAMEQNVGPQSPFYLNVEEDDGERVEIYIG